MSIRLGIFIVISVLQMLITGGCWSGSSLKKSSNDERWTTVSASPKSGERSNASEPDVQLSRNSDIKDGGFQANLPSGFSNPVDSVGKRILREYGAIFVAKGGVLAPAKVVFLDDAEVAAYQKSLETTKSNIGGTDIELQEPAMAALEKAIIEGESAKLTISPRGTDAAKRTYSGTVELWKSRVEPGLKHWVSKGRINKSDAQRISALPPFEQVSEILGLEELGMFFSKDLSKSIMYSVAPPGTSQHLSMLAFDVAEHDQSKIREILARHGWFQTVVSDLPHFTYLGVAEKDLAKLGLKKTNQDGRTYWTPNLN